MKDKLMLNKLAIFGGTPLFNRSLPVGYPNIGSREKLLERFNDILDNRWFTNNGRYVQDFERLIAEFVGVKHCIAMCNATIALQVAIRALNIEGEVIMPAMTFVATAHAFQWQRIKPVFCDIDSETLCIDSCEVEKLINAKTSAIVGVHLFGKSCEIEKLQEIADKHNLKLIFDAAHSFGCSRNKKMVGGFGDLEVFSFHATKFFNTFEGGAVVTNNDDLAEKIRLMKNFGFKGMDNVINIGINGKMTEISAAMGITSLESIDDVIAKNKINYESYKKFLKGIKGLHVLEYNEAEKNNYQYIVLKIKEEYSGISRDELLKILWAENILARRYFYPGCHKMEPYCNINFNNHNLLPVTNSVNKQLLQLPTGYAVKDEDIENICNIIKLCVINTDNIDFSIKAGITGVATYPHNKIEIIQREGDNYE